MKHLSYLKNLHIFLTFICIIFTSACQYIPFQKKEIDPVSITDEVQTRNIDEPNFNDFLDKNKLKINKNAWVFESMFSALLYFNANIYEARQNWRSSQNKEIIAKQRPLSSLGVELGKSDGANGDKSKSIEGLNLLFPLETANKRLIRYEIALNETQLAYETYRKKIWNERINLINQITRYYFITENIKTTRKKLISKKLIFDMLTARFDEGLVSKLEMQKIKIELLELENELSNLQLEMGESKKNIASLIGIELYQLDSIPITLSDFEGKSLNTANEILKNNIIDNWRTSALLDRIDLRIALSEYAIAEAKLKYEIAKQYPDIEFNPAYLFDQGNKIWTFGITTTIPNAILSSALVKDAEISREIKLNNIKNLQLLTINSTENIFIKLSQQYEKYIDAKKIKDQKEELLQYYKQQYQQGIISRYDLELENFKLINFEMIYNQNLFNLINTIKDFENTLQHPLLTEEINYLEDE